MQLSELFNPSTEINRPCIVAVRSVTMGWEGLKNSVTYFMNGP